MGQGAGIEENKRRPTKTGRTNICSGLLVRAELERSLCYHTANGFEERQNHFVCSNYKSSKGTCSVHFMRDKSSDKRKQKTEIVYNGMGILKYLN